nr:MAG TPA: hypothetical protein [Caudoviricetes sp.]
MTLLTTDIFESYGSLRDLCGLLFFCLLPQNLFLGSRKFHSVL